MVERATDTGAHAWLKVASLVAGMVAGAGTPSTYADIEIMPMSRDNQARRHREELFPSLGRSA